MFAQECRDIRAAMPPQLVPLQVPDNVSKPFGQGTLGIDSFDLWRTCKNAISTSDKTCRTRHSYTRFPKCNRILRTQRQKDESIRRQLIKQFHAVIKEQQAQGVGTGARARGSLAFRRYQQKGGKFDATLVAGKCRGNAAVVATQTAKKVRQTLAIFTAIVNYFFS